GTWATQTLTGLIGNRPVSCTPQDRDRYGRIVATCTVLGRDLGRDMVRAGAARAYLRYSEIYLPDETTAKANARGLWSGSFTQPETFRQTAKAPKLAKAAPQDCAIKGNISARGVRIFHVPGQRDYAATRISTAKGEAYFCSEAQAKAAGFRAALR
ncbi:MAG: thermonuclease family protein, partial [Paracoccaceae bacterium]|nr:thermonuclease family protein [Paracoccaceae bacterium]